MIAPVDELIVNADPVLPLAMDQVSDEVSPVAATVTTEDPVDALSETDAEVSVTVTASFVTVIAVVCAPSVFVPSENDTVMS